MKQEISWNKFAVEAFVIVGSILLAIAIDAWWNELQERQLERDYIQRLITDLKSAQDLLENSIEREVNTLNGTKSVIEILETGVTSENLLVADFVRAARLGRNRNNQLHDVTYRELLSSGRFNIIEDNERRREITNFYRTYDFLLDFQEGLQMSPNKILRQTTGRGAPEIILSGINLNEVAQQRLIEGILSNPTILLDLRDNQVTLGYMLTQIDDLLTLSAEIIEKLN